MPPDQVAGENDQQYKARVQSAESETIKRQSTGEAISDQSLIDTHPVLGQELKKLQLNDTPQVTADADTYSLGTEPYDHADTGTGSGSLKVRCPHCHTPMDMAVDTSLTDLTCKSCGSHFSLVDDSKSTIEADTLTAMGRFELLERLGIGGFGTVWKARDTELDRTVTVKIPRRGDMSPKETEKFLREARAAAQLKHPNIVSVHEVGRDGDSVYIVSDFVRGVDLSDWLTKDQLSGREVAKLCIKLAEALHHAHEQGVIHRDLKPANVMMDANGEPHLVDFGLARREMGEVTMTIDGQVLGTPAYMSPEQAQGEAHTADRRSDVYSLGVILFELLTGELPFRGSIRMLLHQVMYEEVPSPRKLNSNVPRDLQTICLKCMEKKPERRYPSANELAEDLKLYLQDKPIVARPVSRVEHVWRWCKRNPMVAGLSAAILIVLSTGVIVSNGFAVVANRNAQIANAEKQRANVKAEETLVAQKAEATQRERANEKQAEAFRAEAQAQAAANLADSKTQAAHAVSGFLIGMFEEPTPFELFGMHLGNHNLDPAARALLDRGEAQLTEGLDNQPLVKAAMLNAIGRAHAGTGATGKGTTLLRQALNIHRSKLSQDDQQIADDLEMLSLSCLLQDLTTESEEFARENLRIRRTVFDESHTVVLRAKGNLALVLGLTNRRISEAEQLWREVLDVRRKSLDPQDPRIAEAMLGLVGVLLWNSNQPSEALSLSVGAAKILSANEETQDLGLGIVSVLRAVLLRRLGNSQQTIVAAEEASHHLKKALGFGHPLYEQAIHGHALALFESDRHEEARTKLDALFARYQEHGIAYCQPDVVRMTLRNFTALLTESGELEELEQILRRVHARQKELTGYRSRNSSTLLNELVAVLEDRGKQEEVQVLMEDYLATSNLLEDTRSLHDRSHLDDVIHVLLSADRFNDAATIVHHFMLKVRLHANVLPFDRKAEFGPLPTTIRELASFLRGEGSYEEAEKIYRRLIVLLEEIVTDYPMEDWWEVELDQTRIESSLPAEPVA